MSAEMKCFSLFLKKIKKCFLHAPNNDVVTPETACEVMFIFVAVVLRVTCFFSLCSV